MKNYNVDNFITEAMERHGAFFAFSDEQFKQQKKEGINYSSMGVGLICPTENADALAIELKNLSKQKRKLK